MEILSALVLAMLVKIATDGAKWLTLRVTPAIPDNAKKAAAYILALAGTQLANLHVPQSFYGPVLSSIEPVLTSLLVAWLSMVVHDAADLLAIYAQNHPTTKKT